MQHTQTISKFAALALALALTGCARQEAGSGGASAQGIEQVQGQGILNALRPKADPSMVERIRQEDANRMQQAALAQQQMNQQMSETDGSGRILPKVSMEPIAPPAEEVASAGAGMSVSADSGAYTPSTSGAVPQAAGMTATPATASYGSYQASQVPAPPSGALGGGLVPPPPAVTLSTTAQTTVASNPGADPNNPYGNPYGNPYANPYGNPYANPYMNPYGIQYQQQQAQPSGDGSPQRPALFGSGKRTPHEESDEDPGAREKAKKFANFVPITPTGMEARSPYKQRDDLRVLWKGAIGSGSLGAWSQKDPNIAASLSRIDVGLPGESTKGSFSVGPRQVDAVFKRVFVDKRIQPQLVKTQNEMVQSYYRYLYSYNRFALSQQTVAARKQEVEVASSHAEQQRAAADLSQAQSEADSSKEDMRSAQLELAAVAGPQAARAVIQKVSGVSPTIESLAQAMPAPEAAPQGGGFNVLGSMGSLFGFNKKKPEEQPAPEPVKAVKADEGKKEKNAGKTKEKETKTKTASKETKPKKGGKAEVAQGDLEPAPSKGESPSAAAQAEAPAASDGISFELKGKNISARKSVLNVSIRNSSDNAFSFSPDDISVQEGNQKLSEAAMRAEFDSTSIAPNGEVKGTITIFGRPWNDRLTISLSDGQRSIHMKR